MFKKKRSDLISSCFASSVTIVLKSVTLSLPLSCSLLLAVFVILLWVTFFSLVLRLFLAGKDVGGVFCVFSCDMRCHGAKSSIHNMNKNMVRKM